MAAEEEGGDGSRRAGQGEAACDAREGDPGKLLVIACHEWDKCTDQPNPDPPKKLTPAATDVYSPTGA